MQKKGTNSFFRIIILLLVLVTAVILAFIFDNLIAQQAVKIRNPFLDYFMLCITFWGSTFLVLFFLTSLLMWHEHKRRWIVPLWIGLSFSAILTYALKFFILRLRPYETGIATFEFLKLGVSATSSFPSLHAAAAFCALPILDKEFPRLKKAWICFAVIVAFSRIYFALHYLSDVLVGAFIGYSLGFFALKLEEKYKIGKKIFKSK